MAYSDAAGRLRDIPAVATTVSPRTYVAVGVLALGVILSALDLTVVAAILPKVMYDLDIPITSVDQAAWIVTAYLLAYTVTMPFLGRVSDVLGRRSVFLVALAVFVVGSVLAANAADLGGMIVARAVQALGGGAMVPVSMAAISDMFPPARRGAALGLIGAADTAGWVIGPLYGALILNLKWQPDFGFFAISQSWRLIFWINVPLGIIAAVLLFFLLPNTRAGSAISPLARRLRQIDVPGAVFLSLALIGLNLALGGGGEGQIFSAGTPSTTGTPFGETNPLATYTPYLLVGAVVALALFVVIELRVRFPLLDPRMFRNATFSFANVTNLLVGGALIVGMVGIPLFVNATYRNDDANQIALQSSLALAPLTLAMALGALGGGILTDRIGFQWTARIGLLLAGGGFLVMSMWTIATGSDIGQLAPGAALTGLGFGVVIAPLGTAVINAARPADAGVAAGLVLIMRLIGMTVGLSLMLTWALAAYTDKVKDIPIAQMSAANSLAPLVDVIASLFRFAAIGCAIAIIPAFGLHRRADSAADAAQEREFGRLL